MARAIVMATATDGDILLKFLSDDTIAVYLQSEERLVTTVPMKKSFERDRAIAAKRNGNIFGRERALIAKFIESYIDYPKIAEIA